MPDPEPPALPPATARVPAMSVPDRLLDLAAVVTVVPALFAVQQAVLGAWRVYHPPARKIRQRPEGAGLPVERMTVAGGGELPLACWFVPAPGPADTVVLGHGIRRDSGSMVELARRLHEAGYHVLAFDMRNHGETAQDHKLRGQSTLTGVDFHRVAAYAASRPEGVGRKIALVGVSMSAWTAMWAARREPAVRAVVCDSGPAMEIAPTMGRTYELARSRLPRLLRGPLMFRLGRAAFVRASVFFFQPAEWPQLLPDPSVPMLFVSGGRDSVVTTADTRAQMTHYPTSSLWVVPRAHHTQAFTMESDEYVRRVLELLEQAGFTPATAAPDGAVPASVPD